MQMATFMREIGLIISLMAMEYIFTRMEPDMKDFGLIIIYFIFFFSEIKKSKNTMINYIVKILSNDN